MPRQLSSLIPLASVVFLASLVTCRPIEEGSFSRIQGEPQPEFVPGPDADSFELDFIVPGSVTFGITGLPFLPNGKYPTLSFGTSDPSGFWTAEDNKPCQGESNCLPLDPSGSQGSQTETDDDSIINPFGIDSLRQSSTNNAPETIPNDSFESLLDNPSEIVLNANPEIIPSDETSLNNDLEVLS